MTRPTSASPGWEGATSRPAARARPRPPASASRPSAAETTTSAGPAETDVLEVVASVRKRYAIDPTASCFRVLHGRGRSWQIGLHNPDLFCGLEVDAGVIGSRLNLDGLTPRAAGRQRHLRDHDRSRAQRLQCPARRLRRGERRPARLLHQHPRPTRDAKASPSARISQYGFVGRDIDALFLATPGQGQPMPPARPRARSPRSTPPTSGGAG